MGVYQVGQRVLHGAVVGPTKNAVPGPQPLSHAVHEALVGILSHCLCAEGQRRRKERGEPAWHHALFHDNSLVQIRAVAHVYNARDARPYRLHLIRGVIPVADTVDGLIGVVCEGKNVTVAAEVAPKPVGCSQSRRLGPQQYLGRAQGAGGQDHYIGADEHGRRVKFVALGFQQLKMYQPLVSAAFNTLHHHLRIYLCAVIPGVREVVHQYRVFGGIVAPGNTVAAVGACVLMHADVIAAVLEIHVNRRLVEPGIEMLCDLLHRRKLGEIWVGIGVGPGLQHVNGAGVAVIQKAPLILPDFLRPTLVLEHPVIRTQCDVGVNQRRTAKTAALEYIDVLVHAEIVHGRAGADVPLWKVGLHLRQRRYQGIGIVARPNFPAPL